MSIVKTFTHFHALCEQPLYYQSSKSREELYKCMARSWVVPHFRWTKNYSNVYGESLIWPLKRSNRYGRCSLWFQKHLLCLDKYTNLTKKVSNLTDRDDIGQLVMFTTVLCSHNKIELLSNKETQVSNAINHTESDILQLMNRDSSCHSPRWASSKVSLVQMTVPTHWPNSLYSPEPFGWSCCPWIPFL